MLAVRAGDVQAFEELMLRYQGRLVTVLEHWTGQRDLAEDLTQEVFLRVYRARLTYAPESKFSTWLYTIANNVASNARRRQSLRREVSPQPAPGAESGPQPLEQLAVAASGQTPSRQLDRAEMRTVVRAALATLNERQRMALLLNKFENLGYEEIATAMQLSVQAVKSLLCRARVNLRQVLEPYLQQGRAPAETTPTPHSPSDA